MAAVNEPMILLPYRELEDLLHAAKEVRQLRQELTRLEAQFGALEGRFFELMEVFHELQ